MQKNIMNIRSIQEASAISRVAFSSAIPRYARHKLPKKQSRLLASQRNKTDLFTHNVTRTIAD